MIMTLRKLAKNVVNIPGVMMNEISSMDLTATA
jgi:hypothetical protein